jgi:hypothetical protein
MDAEQLRIGLEASLAFWWFALALAGIAFAAIAASRILEWREIGLVGLPVPSGRSRAFDGLFVALALLLLQFLFDRIFGDLTALERSARLAAGSHPWSGGELAGGMLALSQVCDAGSSVCQDVVTLGSLQGLVRFLMLVAAGIAVLPVPLIDRSLQGAGLVFGMAALFLVVTIQDHAIVRIATSLALLQPTGG